MITMTHSIQNAVTCNQVIVCALNSITSEQAETVAAIARTREQDWDVYTGYDYDGYRFVLIEPVRHGDEQKSFFVAGITQRLELFEGEGENLALIGTFSDMQALKARLTGLVCQQ